MRVPRNRSLLALGGLAMAVAIVATACAGGNTESAGGTSAPAAATAPRPDTAPNSPQRASSASGASADGAVEQIGVSTDATRVVKTGSLDLTVPPGHVQATITSLTAQTVAMGGYVSASRTENVGGAPTGQLTLRMPAADFDSAVADAATLGHETSLSTTAHDVTGKFVDLQARAKALRQTRQTYLTILGGAKTIGATLSVQQRVDDIQQQLEELQGEIKLLRNQSSDGTLTVSVTQVGSATVVHHKHRGGIGGAWHTSINRFTRGFDGIVGALGPVLLALLIVAFLAGLGGLAYAGVRRITRRPSVVDPAA